MTVRRQDQMLYLEGQCPVEEAEALTILLAAPGPWSVDVSLCRHLHGAVVQALLRFRPVITGASDVPFIRDVLTPALASVNLETK